MLLHGLVGEAFIVRQLAGAFESGGFRKAGASSTHSTRFATIANHLFGAQALASFKFAGLVPVRAVFA
jgi:hypothetical protein